MSKTMIRIEKNNKNPYTMINNCLLQDTSLSWKAKGILAYLLSLPDDWQVYETELVKHATDGKDSLKSGINELVEKNYIHRTRLRDEKGHLKGYKYSIYEIPTESGLSKVGKSKNGKPKNGLSKVGKPATTNTNTTNTNLTNTNNTKEQQQEQEDETKKIKDVVVVLENKITDQEAKAILKAANGNIELVKEKYEIAKVSNYEDLVSWMIRAIQNNYRPSSKQKNSTGRGKLINTKFHNFEQRTSKYTPDELEKMVLDKGKGRSNC